MAAGLDPTGGAGLAADIEALRAVGAMAFPVATALTLQGPRGALDFRPVSPAFLVAQVETLLRGKGPRPDAVKTGMLGSARNALALAEALDRGPLARLPLVVDPVLAASSGLSLLRGTRGRPASALAPLLGRATIVTPNWPELEALAGGVLCDDADAVEAARKLGCRAVLVKGGHRSGDPVDLLVQPRSVRRFGGRRRPGTARGTGCRLASALAGLLARGATLEEAVRGAKRVVEEYLDGPGAC